MDNNIEHQKISSDITMVIIDKFNEIIKEHNDSIGASKLLNIFGNSLANVVGFMACCFPELSLERFFNSLKSQSKYIAREAKKNIKELLEKDEEKVH